MSPTTDTERAIDVAEQAAEAVRALNHLTRGPDILTDPADTYLLLAALAALAQRLPQLLNQINHRLDTDLDPTGLRVDESAPDREPANLLDRASVDLQSAAHLTHHLGAALDSAQQAIAHIAAEDTQRPDERSEMTDQGVSFQPLPRGQFSAAVDKALRHAPVPDPTW